MNKNITRLLLSLLVIAIGGYIGLKNTDNIIYIFGISCGLIAFFIAKVNLRKKNYVGIILTTKKGLCYKLSENEKTIGILILSFMVSPFIFMLVISQYGN